jgi:hypothetical protein
LQHKYKIITVISIIERGLKAIALERLSWPNARKALVVPQKGQSYPVINRKRQKCILGRCSKISTLKTYKAMPEDTLHSSMPAVIVRKNSDADSVIFFILSPEITFIFRFYPENKQWYGYRKTAAAGHSETN